MRDTSAHLVALVGERQSAVRVSFEKLLDAIAQNDVVAVTAANSLLLKDLYSLGNVVARSEWPHWLVDLVGNCSNYESNHANGIGTWKAHLLALIKNKHDVESHQWFVEQQVEKLFDVDEIVEIARRDFKIDDLFDKIVITLEALAECEELDSVRASADLERIIRLLRDARNGSFWAEVATWQFVRRFIPNLMSQYLKKSPTIGSIIEAFEQTSEELNIGLESAKDQIGGAILDRVTSGLKKTSIGVISSSDIKALPDFADVV